MLTSHKHMAAIARDFTLHLMELGFTESQILSGTGITFAQIAEDESMVPLASIAMVFKRGAELTGNDLIGLEWGKTRLFTKLGLIGYLGRTSKDLQTLFTCIARYQRVFSEPIDMDVSGLSTKGEFVWTFAVPADVDVSLLVEAQASQLIAGMRRILPRQISPLSVHFEHHRGDHVNAFERVFGCPVHFGARRNRMVLRPEDLGLPIVTSDGKLHKILERHCELVLAKTPRNIDDIIIRVERAIADRLPAGQANVDVVSRDLGMSARTLARRLGDVGTTFQSTLSNLRCALAERYLKDRSISQTQIAYLLGYSDVSSFASAFKRWTGQSPGQIRHSVA